jgi:hypothetical protein
MQCYVLSYGYMDPDGNCAIGDPIVVAHSEDELLNHVDDNSLVIRAHESLENYDGSRPSLQLYVIRSAKFI